MSLLSGSRSRFGTRLRSATAAISGLGLAVTLLSGCVPIAAGSELEGETLLEERVEVLSEAYSRSEITTKYADDLLELVVEDLFEQEARRHVRVEKVTAHRRVVVGLLPLMGAEFWSDWDPPKREEGVNYVLLASYVPLVGLAAPVNTPVQILLQSLAEWEDYQGVYVDASGRPRSEESVFFLSLSYLLGWARTVTRTREVVDEVRGPDTGIARRPAAGVTVVVTSEGKVLATRHTAVTGQAAFDARGWRLAGRELTDVGIEIRDEKRTAEPVEIDLTVENDSSRKRRRRSREDERSKIGEIRAPE